MVIESMAMGDAGVTALAMVGVGQWSMAGKSIIYSYVGLRIVGIFSDAEREPTYPQSC